MFPWPPYIRDVLYYQMHPFPYNSEISGDFKGGGGVLTHGMNPLIKCICENFDYSTKLRIQNFFMLNSAEHEISTTHRK